MTFINQNRAEEAFNDMAPIANVPCPTLHTPPNFLPKFLSSVFFTVKYFPHIDLKSACY